VGSALWGLERGAAGIFHEKKTGIEAEGCRQITASMGEQKVSLVEDTVEMQEFMRMLLQDVKSLEYMIEHDWFEEGVTRIGAEQEMVLVNSRSFKPSTVAMEALEKMQDFPWVETELARFNLEINLEPRVFEGGCFSAMEKEVRDHLEKIQSRLHDLDTRVLLTGILPTLRKHHLTMDNLTPKTRYKALMTAIDSHLQRSDYELKIVGIDELHIKHDSPLLEACNTSFQVHLQVAPDDFARMYNISQALAAPVIAIGANSPLVYGKRLWHESRIALFQQAIDTRTSHEHMRDQSARVSFGNGWLNRSIMEIYKEDIARFRVLLAGDVEENSLEEIEKGNVPSLRALQVHNSTVYRWNRPCYGISPNGKPHLRIENRVLPAGPTVIDEVANAAFWLGAMVGMADQVKDIRELMSFDDARDNFTKASKFGVDSNFTWFKDRKVTATELVAKELLPIARAGLEKKGVRKSDIDRYLGIIEERARLHTNGARWQLRGFTALKNLVSRDEAVTGVTSATLKNQRLEKPIHTWEMPTMEDLNEYRPSKIRVEEFMETDLFTVQKDDILELVAEMMDWRKIRYMPVEDAKGNLVGLITSRLLLRYFTHKNTPKGKDQALVKDVMIQNPISISPTATIVEAMKLMREKSLGCLPVVKNGELIGIMAYGIDDPGYSIDAVFFDYDNDGDLDLYVTNRPGEFFLNLVKIEARRPIRDVREEDQLYRNDGNGRFTRVTREAGITDNFGFGLSVTAADINGDGYQDLYVSNDFLESDYLYMNQGDGTFKEESKKYLGHVPFYSMGTDIMDFNNDGWEDIFTSEMLPEDYKRSKTSMAAMNVTEFNMLIDYGMHHQYMHNALQVNRGNGYFSEISEMAGVKNTDWSWATFLADFDNDGLRDLFVANGYKRDVYDNDANTRMLEWERENSDKPRTEERLNEYLNILPRNPQVNYVYKNAGDYRFEKVSHDWGFREASFSNGATLADLNGDGTLDLIINNLDQEAYIFKNHAAQTGHHYLRVKLEGPAQNTFGLGARIEVHAGDRHWVEQLKVSRGYQSCTEPIAHFGLGDTEEVDYVKVVWHDGKETRMTGVEVDQVVTLSYENAQPGMVEAKAPMWMQRADQELFADDWKHIENEHDDYREQILLPHKMSELGPYMSVGDINGDGLDDLFVGGAKDQAGCFFTQTKDGRLKRMDVPVLERDKVFEDIGSVLVDVDGDGDLDLYVVSGGVEYRPGSGFYQDRLYINDGKGNFTSSNDLPVIQHSGSVVVAGDFNGDGEVDFFVGGRVVPDKYPFPPQSYLLIRENGKWVDKTADLAPDFEGMGMVTDAVVTDLSGGDKPRHLVVVGEWMAPRIFDFSTGKLVDKTEELGMPAHTGWSFGVALADLDGDGDLDIIAGNLGLNYKLKASDDKPFHIYCDDFDNNGSYDIVLAKKFDGELVPVRGRQCSSDQMPFIKDKFPTFTAFADASVRDIYGEDLGDALHYVANHYTSGVYENTPEGFVFHAFPTEAQFGPIQDIAIRDVDGDGKPDLLVAGNMYQSERETTRADGSIGLVLRNVGGMQFEAVSWLESGWFLPGDVRDIVELTAGSTKYLVVATNNYSLRAFKSHVGR
jgi:enediyne biosynthesis protein E4